MKRICEQRNERGYNWRAQVGQSSELEEGTDHETMPDGHQDAQLERAHLGRGEDVLDRGVARDRLAQSGGDHRRAQDVL